MSKRWDLRESTRFWRSVPWPRQLLFYGAVFFTFSTIGFFNDLLVLGRQPLAQVWTWALYSGALAATAAWTGTQRPLLLLPVLLVGVLVGPIIRMPAEAPPAGLAADPEELAGRIQIDVAAAGVAVILGYTLFISFIATEGNRSLRLQTEIALARELHRSLVPPLALQVGRYQIRGASFPTADVGGDLVDVVAAGAAATAYVADVSGHGVPAGALMGMCKSAVRMRLLEPSTPEAVLTDLNEVLFAVKRPSMFVTCACVHLHPDGELTYAVAGHLPVLHYRRATGTVGRLSTRGPALGLRRGERYQAGRAAAAPGDLLALVSDGLTEVGAGHGELGLEPFERWLAEEAEAPLELLLERLLERARRHGPQRDDQTLLLVRVS